MKKYPRLLSKHRLLLCGLASLAALVSTPPAQAFSSLLSSWTAAYPGSSSGANAGCQLCHAANNFSQFNSYGWDLKQNGLDYAAIENLNSDNDPTSSSNLEEINASTQPGWTPGANNAIDGGSVTNTALPPAGIAGSLDPIAANQLPTADPNGPYSGTEGIPVAFDGSASTDPDGTIVSYAWDFGDGATGSGMAPSHTYQGTGTFDVTLSVTDDAGDSASATTTATIGAGNQPPTADPNGPYTGTSGTPVAFDGSGSTDSDGTIVSYTWDFGDGATGTGMAPSHTYTTQGTYNVTLTVTDDSNAVDSATTSAAIDATNQAPTANPNGPYTGAVGVALSFDGTGSSDPDGTIVAYAWDFGDGTSGTGSVPSHTYASAGSYNITLSVTDDGGLSNTATTTAAIGSVANLPPVAVANGPYSGTVGLPVSFDSTGSNDPDGTLATYHWDFGDGATATGANPTYAYTAQGTYSVTLTVTDNEGAMGSDTTTATIGVGNQAPVA
ncbi:MAG: PKD domain-containing protein, partial [Candidatus Thiodiazotropha sp. (ex Dulcina madagascariensis)]|nr:PKD domain-containing protein [Candidatus Thiodiazotropha sp. (ex Dulcina madagascariensis)]